MTETVSLGAAVAFVAGLLSFLSPCVLPLVPSYLGFITGFTIEEMTGRRRLAMLHALLFVIGFSIVFILLGAIVGFVSVIQYRRVLKTLKPVEIPEGYWINMAAYTNLLLGIFGVIIIAYFFFGDLGLVR